MNDSIKKAIEELLTDNRDAFVGSVSEEGYPNLKAMFIVAHEGVNTIWFSTNVSSMRVRQWRKNTKSCVYLAAPGRIMGVMLEGEMQVHTDEETKRRFWREGDEMYYPAGPMDPDYCMVCFRAKNANLWHGQKIVDTF